MTQVEFEQFKALAVKFEQHVPHMAVNLVVFDDDVTEDIFSLTASDDTLEELVNFFNE